MISKDHGTHWKLHLPDRSPLDPYRLWMWDRRGFRQDNWYNAPNDCDEKIEKVKKINKFISMLVDQSVYS